ncbi:MAG TPA: pyruvate, phosphate dikinase [Actinomycetota bacterium]|nr:pyruvate, phosphate dikinase [Actinomycetota bacterium]
MAPTKTKYVYDFREGNKEMKDLLGGKGANLAEMTNLGLPVPPGFTISTEACIEYLASGGMPEGLFDEVDAHLRGLEQAMGRRLGDLDNPLLVSVRSGAKYSMPGMMDTVLNLGLNDRSVLGLARRAGSDRFAFDSYRRFIQMFGKIVMDIPGEAFDEELERAKAKKGPDARDTDLTAIDLMDLVERFKGIVKDHAGRLFPTDPREQLRMAIEAVFGSWNNERAKIYRKQYGIPDDLGTAVNVVAMVFGNLGDDSGTGVAFTRDPATGEKGIYGDYLPNAQGEDVVAGIRNTLPLTDLKRLNHEAFRELLDIMRKLERHYRDMCDIEFTIENGKLWMLQTRVGKRTGGAAVRMAVDMAGESLIKREEAVLRVEPDHLDQLLHPQFDPKADIEVLAKGLNASPGAAVGKAVFDADLAAEMGEDGEAVILVRRETNPDDLHGMIAARGILTSHGGKTSHAAVVARGMGKPAVVGAEALKIDGSKREFAVDGTKVREGDVVSIDGTTGRVVLGEVALVEAKLSGEFETLLSWADQGRQLKVRANADDGPSAAQARKFGAEGIGLCRTEHMFGTPGDPRLPTFRQVILSAPAARAAQLALEDAERAATLAPGAEKKEADRRVKEARARLRSAEIKPYFEGLKKLLAAQRKDFEAIFKAMDGLPVTIRLLDPPLHEFLPSSKELEVALATSEQKASRDLLKEFGGKRRAQEVLREVVALEENNPMLGLRGCRLGILYPDIYRTQVQAIIEAACNVKKRGGDPIVEIMVPLVATREELAAVARDVREVTEEVLERRGVELPYMVGTMIELPRAAMAADEIAEEAEFFSFGTNDLTQTTFGFSRDDVEGKFMARYLEERILPANPFETLDERGVGELVQTACERGRKARDDIKLGICGEHGGDPDSVAFFHRIGLDYVSCSPYRVPIARLAAAHAALGEREEASK